MIFKQRTKAATWLRSVATLYRFYNKLLTSKSCEVYAFIFNRDAFSSLTKLTEHTANPGKRRINV